jgi:hypothetical protein
MPNQLDQFRAFLKLSVDGLTSSLKILPITGGLAFLGLAVQIDAAIEAMRMSQEIFGLEEPTRKNPAA